MKMKWLIKIDDYNDYAQDVQREFPTSDYSEELTGTLDDAIGRAKEMLGWDEYKIALVFVYNPEWKEYEYITSVSNVPEYFEHRDTDYHGKEEFAQYAHEYDSINEFLNSRLDEWDSYFELFDWEYPETYMELAGEHYTVCNADFEKLDEKEQAKLFEAVKDEVCKRTIGNDEFHRVEEVVNFDPAKYEYDENADDEDF